MDIAKSQPSQANPLGLLCWCPSGCTYASLSLHLSIPSQPHLPATVATVPFPMWYIKANYCLLRLSPVQQQRSPQEKEQHLSFALGSWEGLELVRVTRKPIVSNHTMDHSFR